MLTNLHHHCGNSGTQVFLGGNLIFYPKLSALCITVYESSIKLCCLFLNDPLYLAGDASNSTEVQDLKNQVANLTDIVSRLKEQVDDLSEVVAALRQRDASASSSFAGSDIEYKKRKVVGVKSSAPYGGGKGGDRKAPMLNNFEVSSDHENDIYAEALDVGSLNVFMEEWKLLSENSLSGPGGGGKHKGDLKSSAIRTAASSSSSSAAVGSAAGPDKLDFTHLLESLPSDLKVRFVDQLADQFGKQLTGASGLTAQHSTSSSSSNMQVFQQYLNHNPNSNLSSTMNSSFYANQSFNPSAMNNNSNFQGFPMQNHVQLFSSEGASQGNALDISLPLASAALGAFMSNMSGFEQFSSNDAGGNNGSSNDISNNDNILNSLPDSLDNWYFNI